MPRELYMLEYIDRFGATNVLGRPLGYGEIQRMVIAENIVRAYNARKASDNWAVWAQKNREANRLLEQAMRAANGESTD